MTKQGGRWRRRRLQRDGVRETEDDDINEDHQRGHHRDVCLIAGLAGRRKRERELLTSVLEGIWAPRSARAGAQRACFSARAALKKRSVSKQCVPTCGHFRSASSERM